MVCNNRKVSDEQDHLHHLIRRARRRQAWHLLVHAASFGALIAIAGVILLLILGAQVLNWYWIVALFVVGLASGAYQSRGNLWSPYRVAQFVDRQLGFKDALSTAYYFSRHSERMDSAEVVRIQRESAEELARSADVAQGMPFRRPRTAYVNLMLVAVAFGMFGLRYGIHRSLDLGPPLVHVNLDGWFGTSRQYAQVHRGKLPGAGNGPRDSNAANNPPAVNPNANDPEPNPASQSVQDPAANNGKTSPDGAGKAEGKANEQAPPNGDPLDSGEKGDSSQQQKEATNSSNGADSKSSQQNGSGDSKDAKDASNSQSGKSGDNSSLASKLRDALSNLMAKMNPQSKSGAGKPNDSSQASKTQSSQQRDKQQGGTKSPGQEQAEASANSQDGEQQQGGTQQAQQGKSQGQSSDQPNSPDGKSGIGKQEGDKAAREAAELAAMGKLSEIIGKRAQNISGEVMVEVSPGKQQLKTQYSQQNATHSDRGSEIDRDEVPLAYQQYVEQYFAQIRKMPAAKAKSQPAGSGTGTKPASTP